jgi:NADH-quinone oxidoreductase subunit A
MFVVFDVLAMFLYAWGVSSTGLGPQSSIIVLMFLAIMFIPLGYAMHLAGRRELW